MKNDVSNRFIECYNYLVDNNKIKDKKSFAEAIGISTSMITEIIKGRSNVGLAAIQNTVLNFNINPGWLLTGSGNLISNNDNNQNEPEMNCNNCPYKKIADNYEKLVDRLNDENNRLNDELSTLRNQGSPESKRHSA